MVTVIACTLAFIGKAFIQLASIGFSVTDHDNQLWSVPWSIALIYFFVLDTLPVTIMLWLLHIMDKNDMNSENDPLISE